MDEYRKRIAKTAFRFMGERVTLSPQLDHSGESPTFPKRIAGREPRFRVVLYTGYIHPNDLKITIPDDTILKVHVKHDVKATDIDSYRSGLEPNGTQHRSLRSTRPLLCSRDCATYFRLPHGVVRQDLTAQWTRDRFLIIQAREPRISKVTSFHGNRLVPVEVCEDLDPWLDLDEVSSQSNSLLEAALQMKEGLDSLMGVSNPWNVESRNYSEGSQGKRDSPTGVHSETDVENIPEQQFDGSCGHDYTLPLVAPTKDNERASSSTVQLEVEGSETSPLAPSGVCASETGSTIQSECAGTTAGSPVAGGIGTGSLDGTVSGNEAGSESKTSSIARDDVTTESPGSSASTKPILSSDIESTAEEDPMKRVSRPQKISEGTSYDPQMHMEQSIAKSLDPTTQKNGDIGTRSNEGSSKETDSSGSELPEGDSKLSDVPQTRKSERLTRRK